jgi:hypothetical protein
MSGIVYANCRAALRQQSRRCSADASSAACHECYLVAPRSHSSSVSTFVPPAHSSSNFNIASNPQRRRTNPARCRSDHWVGCSLPVLKSRQPREPSSQITVQAFILPSNTRSRIRSAARAPCSIAYRGAIEAIVVQMLHSERNGKLAK